MEENKRYNVIALFPETRRAQRVVRSLVNAGVPKDHVEVQAPGRPDAGHRAAMRAEMQDELNRGYGGPSVGFMTRSQAFGAFWGVVVFAAAGAALGAMIGLAWAVWGEPPFSPFWTVVLSAGVWMFGISAAGFIAGGAIKPRSEMQERNPGGPIDRDRLEAEQDALVAVHTDDPSELERAEAIVRREGAVRVDLVNEDGTPLPPQEEHHRPADTDDRFWEPGQAQG